MQEQNGHYSVKSSKFAIRELEQRGGLRDNGAASRLKIDVDKGKREVSLMEGLFLGLDCQFVMWYREVKRGQDDGQPYQGLPKAPSRNCS